LDQEFACILCKYTCLKIIIYIYWLGVGPYAKRLYSKTKTNLACAYWPMDGIVFKHIGLRLEYVLGTWPTVKIFFSHFDLGLEFFGQFGLGLEFVEPFGLWSEHF